MSQTPPPSTLVLGFYSRRPATVAAVRVTQDNAAMVAEWCRGAVTWVGALPRVSLDTPFGTAVVVTGDWVVRDETGEFRPLDDDAFSCAYQSLASHPIGDHQ